MADRVLNLSTPLDDGPANAVVVVGMLERVMGRLDSLSREQADQRRLIELALNSAGSADKDSTEAVAVTHALAQTTAALSRVEARLSKLERGEAGVRPSQSGAVEAAVDAAFRRWRRETAEAPSELEDIRDQLVSLQAAIEAISRAAASERSETPPAEGVVGPVAPLVDGASERLEALQEAISSLPRDIARIVQQSEGAPLTAIFAVGFEASLDRFENLLDREEVSVDAISDLGESLTRVALEATADSDERFAAVETRIQALLSEIGARTAESGRMTVAADASVSEAQGTVENTAATEDSAPAAEQDGEDPAEWLWSEANAVAPGAIAATTADSIDMTGAERLNAAAHAGDAVGWRSPWSAMTPAQWWEDDALSGAFGVSDDKG